MTKYTNANTYVNTAHTKAKTVVKYLTAISVGVLLWAGLNQIALAQASDQTHNKTKPIQNSQADSTAPKQKPNTQKTTSSPSSFPTSKQEKTLIATIETNLGTMKLSLFYQQTPITVSNFMTLAQKGYYNGVIFHRVISGFMIQGGDPQGTGMGGPGYTFQDEFVSELKHHKKGILSMANAGPSTNGSQFFITLAPTPHLDGKHTVFGELIEGEDVLDRIGTTATKMDRPIKEVVMKKVTVTGDFKPVKFKKKTNR